MYNITYSSISLMAEFPHPVRTAWKMLAQLRVDNPNISNLECAKQLGVNAITIGSWLRQPLYQSFENFLITDMYEGLPLAVKSSRADVQKELDEFAHSMLYRLQEITETSQDDKLVATIGMDALDRAGFGPKSKNDGKALNLVLTPELLAILTTRAKEITGDVEVVVGEVL